MDKQYDHSKYEKDIYDVWESSGSFSPSVSKDTKPFTIIMPPPNSNDPLHIGHARFVAVEDILIRYHRLKGEAALWLPGSDHAGIETQFVFEKKLREKGQSRFDFDRDTLYSMIWDYVHENTGIMHNQLRQLGASCDWTRHKFTLDADVVAVVYKTFKKLHEDGLVYRGKRIVNYCPRCGTNFSELEVDHVEREDTIYHLTYGTITIATTRPETIFADVAIAVNPKDQRYKRLVGKTALIPLLNREIPIIADTLVDMEFGTGALKVTPGHDQTDFTIGEKHNLPTLSVIDETGRMINTPKKYVGLKIAEAREVIVHDLEEQGLLVKKEKIIHNVGVCYRCKGVIEPMISEQWFIRVKPLTERAIDGIKQKQITFNSKKYEKMATHWLKNLRDWNISRQIVWGIRIPAYRCTKCLEWTITDGEAPEKCIHCMNTAFKQDEDTFDTWFSSGQWPYASLQTTNEGDFEYFYPTSVMNTSYDIIPFWVIRMIMLGYYRTEKEPFQSVVIHGLVRDKNGVKISKSKGNVIDPIEMATKYGSDALRMGLLWGALVENDIALSEDTIRAQRNFGNKIWNMARFMQMMFETHSSPVPQFNKRILAKQLHNDDIEILTKYEKTAKKVSKELEKFRLNDAAEIIYHFMWDDLAAFYLERIKSRDDKAIALSVFRHVFENSLIILHPFMPFLTEAVWKEISQLRTSSSPLLINENWPVNS